MSVFRQSLMFQKKSLRLNFEKYDLFRPIMEWVLGKVRLSTGTRSVKQPSENSEGGS